MLVLQNFLEKKEYQSKISLSDLENVMMSEQNHDWQKNHRYNLFQNIEKQNSTGTDRVIQAIKDRFKL